MASQQISQAQQLTAEQQQARRQQILRQQKQQQLRTDKINPQKYNFASTTSEILAKYAKYPPSLNFHIYESHYRFNNLQDSTMVPKNSPVIKSFLQHILKEEIPIEMSELLKDFSIRVYDGCIILQVYDHRNMVSNGSNTDSKAKPTDSSASLNQETSSNGTKPESSKEAESSNSDSSNASGSHKPKTYRTLLRPTQLSIYYDLLYHTDSALTKFTDPLSLQMESEILSLTQRNLDLSVPLNPYLCEDYLHPESEFPKKVWDEKTQEYILIHSHREAIDMAPRRLHQDEVIMHKSSDYEEIMFLLSNKYRRNDELSDKKLVVVGPSSLSTAAGTTTTAVSASSQSTDKDDILGTDSKTKKSEKESSSLSAATLVKSNPSTGTASTGQFMRLRFIEEIRKRKEAQKAQQEANGGLLSPPSMNPNSQVEGTSGLSQQQRNNIPNTQSPNLQQAAQSQGRTMPVGNMQKQQYLNEKMQAMRAQQLRAQQAQQVQQAQQAQQAQTRQKMSPQSMVPRQANKRQKKDMVTESVGQSGQQYANTPPNAQVNQKVTNSNPAALNNAPARVNPNAPHAQSSSGQTLQQQQQQQIFQNSLTPQEQQTFRQLQSRMNAFAMMGNSGIAPNRTQLTQQQQQQAIQQAKLIQQQLIQKFPIYFQRLRQFQLLQQQRQQQQGQQQHPQQFLGSPNSQIPDNGAQFNRGVSGNVMQNGMSQQQRYNQQMLQQMANMNELEKRKNAYNKTG